MPDVKKIVSLNRNFFIDGFNLMRYTIFTYHCHIKKPGEKGHNPIEPEQVLKWVFLCDPASVAQGRATPCAEM